LCGPNEDIEEAFNEPHAAAYVTAIKRMYLSLESHCTSDKKCLNVVF
jgi:hypothetical protein